MAVAETAQLVVNLSLKDQLSGGLSRAEAQLAGLNRTAGTTNAVTAAASGGISKLGVVAASVGGSLSHAKNQLLGLAANMGLLAGGAGIASAVGLLGTSVKKIEDFGAALERVKTLTGETDLASGALILQFQKFGIETDRLVQVVGFTEKTLGKLNETTAKGAAAAKSAALVTLEDQKLRLQAAGASTKHIDALIKEQQARDKLTASTAAALEPASKLDALDKQYGLHLVDSTGKVADFSTVLSQLATFYDSNASASTKAYVASQVFGRGYTTMIPILNEGAAGLRQAAADAASLGLNSAATAKQIADFHDQMHAFENQVNVLQLAVGTALLPELIDLSKAATDFVQNNRAGIVGFFRDSAQFARDFAAAAAPVVGFFGNLVGAWTKLPSELKTLLIGGFVANKASSWLFGTSLTSLLKGGASALGGLRGATPLDPVFVKDVTGGLPGLPGAGVGGGGLLSFLTSGAGLAAIAAAGVAVLAADAYLTQNNRGPAGGPPTPENKNTYSPSQSGLQIQTRNPAFIAQQQAYYSQAVHIDGIAGKAIDDLTNATKSGVQGGFIGKALDDFAMAVERGTRPIVYTLLHSNLFRKAAAVREATGMKYSGQVLEAFLGGKGGVSAEQAYLTGQAVSIAEINALRTPGNDRGDLSSAEYQLGHLKGLQKALEAAGDHTWATKIGADIASLSTAIDKLRGSLPKPLTTTQIQGAVERAGISPGLRGRDAGTTTIRNDVTVNVSVSARDIQTATTSRSTYTATVVRGNRPAPGAAAAI